MLKKSNTHILKHSGFALIELFIVISVISALAVAIFLAIDPLAKFQDARDIARISDISQLSNAIKIGQAYKDGTYVDSIATLVNEVTYMIGTDAVNCNAHACNATIDEPDRCVDLTDLKKEGYINEIPVSPSGSVRWTAGHTGYYIKKGKRGAITIGACESENVSAIEVVR